MQYPNLFKRIIPFALALTLGLFAGSFVTSLSPTRSNQERYSCPLKGEYRDLKTENARLKLRVEELEQKYEVPCEKARNAISEDLLLRRCFTDELPVSERELRKQLMEREKQLAEQLRKLERKEKK